MRFVSLAPALFALFVPGAAHAQNWLEYVNRGDFFTVNFPGEPDRQDITYKTAKGTSLPAHVYSAQDARGGRYSVTVVDYNSAAGELPAAIEEASKMVREKGTVKYQGQNMLDNHRSWRLSVEVTNQRVLLAEVLVAMNNRLYISQAETGLNVAPPAQYQASLGILDEDGVKIRYRSVGSTERVR